MKIITINKGKGCQYELQYESIFMNELSISTKSENKINFVNGKS